tara:strand:+ start:223 stop:711 length:489 start_codon:yes stop_codon:yes gene_type:complete
MNIKEHKAKKIADRLANQLYIDVKAKRELKEDQITEVTQTLSNLTQTLNIAEALDIDDMTPEEVKNLCAFVEKKEDIIRIVGNVLQGIVEIRGDTKKFCGLKDFDSAAELAAMELKFNAQLEQPKSDIDPVDPSEVCEGSDPVVEAIAETEAVEETEAPEAE